MPTASAAPRRSLPDIGREGLPVTSIVQLESNRNNGVAAAGAVKAGKIAVRLVETHQAMDFRHRGEGRLDGAMGTFLVHPLDPDRHRRAEQGAGPFNHGRGRARAHRWRATA